MFIELFLAVVVVIVSLAAWFYKSHGKIREIVDKLPGPPSVPILGNVLQLKSDGAEFFTQLCGLVEKYGRKEGIFRIWLGTHPLVFLVSADAAEVVFDEQAKVLMNKLDQKAGKGTFDIYPCVTLCALDIICETAMGCSVNAQGDSESKYVKAIYKMGTLVQQRAKSPWLWPDIIFNQLSVGQQHQECLDILKGFTRKVIKERHAELEKMLSESEEQSKGRTILSEEDIDDQMKLFAKQGKKRLAFLDMLLYSARGENGMTFDDIQEEVDTFMFEGHDTTTAATSWSCYLIGKHPDVQEKLQEEVDSVIGPELRPLTASDLKQMKYLECVIKEALRLYPSAAQFGREISEDTKIAGYDIPKGTTAVVLVYSLHRDPRHFPNPDKFDPDRWAGESSSSRHPYCYVPFSAGLRNCIGQKFAMMEEKTLLANIVHKFHITSKQTKEELKPVSELILRPENGILVELHRRH